MKYQGNLLLVDDESGFRENVAERMATHGFQVFQAGEAESALLQARGQVMDVALLDILMPGMDGLTLLGTLKEIDPLTEVVIVTGQGSIESAVEAMRRGAFHYVTKPVRLTELEMVVRRAIEKAALARQNRAYRENLRRRNARSAAEIVARSPAMQQVLRDADRMASLDAPILIEGETGTGKEVLAERIHERSGRAAQTFSVLNCGAIPESLVDAELFGYEKGAFTGAVECRPGIFEVTDGGTLLLDEIGDITANAQVRLLRVLERGLFRRVGATREQSADVRVLASTHRDLDQEVLAGRFREDLFHRLHVFRLRLPPLRERRDDIFPLAEFFLGRLAGPGAPQRSLSAAAQAALLVYPWPGNVRELAHTMERACFAAQLTGNDEVQDTHLGLPVAHHGADILVSLEEAQRRHIQAVLARLDGNRKKAAEVLGITERHLYRLLKDVSSPDLNVR